MNQPPSRALMISLGALGLLLLLTPALLIWQHLGMTRVVEISAAQPHGATVTDDRYERGNSVGSLRRTQDALVMHCALRQGYDWPFCKLQFLVGAAGKGVDFSQFDQITFNLDYAGPSPRHIRLYLINFEPGRSTAGDWNSQRFNQIEFELPAQSSFTIPMNVLRTADWWVAMRKVPLDQIYTRLDHVTAVELSTGNIAPGQTVVFTLRAIQFRGKWIARSALAMYLLYAWIACGVLALSLSLLHFRAGLLASDSRLQLLATINKALELEARELADQAHTDPLTGALNRQGLRETLMRRLHANGPYGGELAVVFMDIDHFKQVNDRHGHDAGDEVLRRFAAITRGVVRASDKLVRWGGEEFLLVCLGTSGEQAAVMAEKLRAAMASADWPHGLRLTASFGVTALRPEEDIGAAIARADRALYQAKTGGRNRAELA